MKLCYLLESTELSGGVRIAFDQARALQSRGHHVLVRALSGDHSWYPHKIAIDYVSDLSSDFRDNQTPDIIIATFWTTVKAAIKLKSKLTFHLCQGYEGSFMEYAALRTNIEAVYRLPIAKITIGEWLSDILKENFGKDSFSIYNIGQIVDLEIFRPLPTSEKQLAQPVSRQVRILIVGHFGVSVKGIPYALHAVKLLRGKGIKVYLIRVSPGNLITEEASITLIDEYHTHISPSDMNEIYQKSDLLLSPSLTQEGFGLPFAEALACGIPTVATEIPSYLDFDPMHDYTCFVPEKDPAAMADAALKIIGDRHLQKHLRARGIEVINNNFRSGMVADRLEAIFHEALK